MNILPLGSYDVLIYMDWLEQHHVMLDCLHKLILCTGSQGNQINIQGLPKNLFIRKICFLQAKKGIWKGCKIFGVNIQDVEAKIEQQINDFHFLIDFKDLFSIKYEDYHQRWT